MNSKLRLARGAVFCLCVLHSACAPVGLAASLAGAAPADRVLGVDVRGVPVLCGTGGLPSAGALQQKGGTANGLPGGTRGWETIPSAVRRNGVDMFRLEVDAVEEMASVTFECPPALIPESGGTQQSLRDDGQGQDRVAGDRIWTSVLLRANPAYPILTLADYNTNSPAGLSFVDLGPVRMVGLDGVTNEFLISPQVGIMEPGIPLRTPLALSASVQATPHLANVRGSSQAVQKQIRSLSSDLENVTAALYGVAPDVFDFLIFFSTDHVEEVPRESSLNYIAGVHTWSKVNYSGTGAPEFDISSFWGSQGRLLGLCLLDAGDRGVSSSLATHELLHQWGSFTGPNLGLSDEDNHYNYRSSAASLLGGTQFVPTNGGFLVNCGESRLGAHYAAPLDKYLMGLIDGSAVPPIQIASSTLPSPFWLCNQVISTGDIAKTITIEDIQQTVGVRMPGPGAAQRDFSIGFVIESNERLLNATEMTFYEILGESYTRVLPAGQPAPRIELGWPPISRFFGEGTTWRSSMSTFAPTLVSVTPMAGSIVVIRGSGFPGASYTLEGSTNLVNWQPVATVLAAANGEFACTNTVAASRQFYRALWQQ